mmetsp:Transcript_39279/g.57982  ORF Transcript_39279/g.57982 Transcript_39279/m.57982 type:complete len:217 (-) Transcript_39279:509-1159(-)
MEAISVIPITVFSEARNAAGRQTRRLLLPWFNLLVNKMITLTGSTTTMDHFSLHSAQHGKQQLQMAGTTFRSLHCLVVQYLRRLHPRLSCQHYHPHPVRLRFQQYLPLLPELSFQQHHPLLFVLSCRQFHRHPVRLRFQHYDPHPVRLSCQQRHPHLFRPSCRHHFRCQQRHLQPIRLSCRHPCPLNYPLLQFLQPIVVLMLTLSFTMAKRKIVNG